MKIHFLIALTLLSDCYSLGFLQPSSLVRLALSSFKNQSTLGQGPYDVQTECEDQFQKVIDDERDQDLLTIYISSGKGINDLGNFYLCEDAPTLKYALITIKSLSYARLLV